MNAKKSLVRIARTFTKISLKFARTFTKILIKLLTRCKISKVAFVQCQVDISKIQHSVPIELCPSWITKILKVRALVNTLIRRTRSKVLSLLELKRKVEEQSPVADGATERKFKKNFFWLFSFISFVMLILVYHPPVFLFA